MNLNENEEVKIGGPDNADIEHILTLFDKEELGLTIV